MSLRRHPVDVAPLDPAARAAWAKVPPAVASDCMNRAQSMGAQMKPLAPGTQLLGPARTVEAMVGDNSAIHAAARIIGTGEVLVVDAQGFPDTAVFGGLIAREMMRRGAAGIVVHGAVRDAAEIREMGFPCFSTAIAPAGPHKGFGGTLDGTIGCAGCVVRPGDLVLGDDDGVAVVPAERLAAVLAAAEAKLAQEEEAVRVIAQGVSLADHLGVPEPEVI